MITWLIGENSFEVREALQSIEAASSVPLERFDATELTLNQLPDILMGVSLFANERLVVIRDITLNSALWEKVPEWLPRISDAIYVVFVDTKPDKRTTSYKALKAAADVQEFPAWTEKDTRKAEQWVQERARSIGMTLDSRAAAYVVERVGVEQWQLASALETLSLLDEVTKEVIDEVIPANLAENIFQLFETALDGKVDQVTAMLATLKLQEDPYALFALMSSQALSLAAVTYADDTANPAKDFAIHPFVASKLTRHAKKLGKTKVGRIVEAFANTDAGMKRSKAEPWVLVERLLLEIVATAR